MSFDCKRSPPVVVPWRASPFGVVSRVSHLEAYRREMFELHLARVEAGGSLTQDEESKFVERLDHHWQAMSEEDQATIEEELAGLKVSEEPQLLDREVFIGSETTPRIPL